jgi:hypothetical protein
MVNQQVLTVINLDTDSFQEQHSVVFPNPERVKVDSVEVRVRTLTTPVGVQVEDTREDQRQFTDQTTKAEEGDPLITVQTPLIPKEFSQVTVVW